MLSAFENNDILLDNFLAFNNKRIINKKISANIKIKKVIQL